MKPSKYVIAIDPGTTESGVCIVRTEDYKPLWCAKVPNEELLDQVFLVTDRLQICCRDCVLVIERMYNPKAASSHVFLTCEWIGRFDVLFSQGAWLSGETAYLYRYEEYRFLCGKEYAHNDKGVKSALVDRFAYGEANYGKGTKKAPGWFYGFAADTWSAYAIAVTFIDREAG